MDSRSGRPDLPSRIEVGRVLRAHGVKGELRVAVFSDVPGRFEPGARFHLRDAVGPAVVTLRSLRDGGDSAIVRFDECATREEAEALRGAVLEIDRGAVPRPDGDTWYTFELVGCRCRDEVAGELGRVVDLIEDGGGWLLEVADGERTVTIPWARPFLVRVDVEAGEIDLRLPEGLVEACTSGS